MSNFAKTKPHAVLIPCPSQGHINALLKLGKLLHLRGFHITFVNTEYNHQCLVNSRGLDSLDGFKDFNFETIPNGFTAMESGDVFKDVYLFFQSIMTSFLEPFGELLARLDASAAAGLIPPVTSIVSDCYMPFTVDAAEERALPIVLFSPVSACCSLTTSHIPKLFQNGVLPLKGISSLFPFSS